jgi:hypothetical protein
MEGSPIHAESAVPDPSKWSDRTRKIAIYEYDLFCVLNYYLPVESASKLVYVTGYESATDRILIERLRPWVRQEKQFNIIGYNEFIKDMDLFLVCGTGVGPLVAKPVA